MNPLYQKAKDFVVMRRTADNKEFEEFPMIVSDSSVIATDIDNNLFCYKICELLRHVLSASYSETGSFAYTSSYAVSSSHAISSSHALDALSASYSLSGSYVISASYAHTASFALEASSAFSAAFASHATLADWATTASYAITASHEIQIDITASWASASLSASYAETASYGANFLAPRVTASYMSSSFNVITNQLTASTALIRGTTFATSSWAINAMEANSATAAGSASAALWARTASLADLALVANYATTAIGLDDGGAATIISDSVSWISNVDIVAPNFVGTASQATSASYTYSASYAESASYGTNFLAPRVTASYVSSSFNVITNQLTASNALVSGLVRATSSYALSGRSSSYADWAQISSMSLGTQGLNVQNTPPQPNSQVAWITRDPNSPTPVYITQSQIAAETRPHTAVKVNGDLYGGGWNGWIYVIKNPDQGLSNITSSSFIGGNYISQVAYLPDTGYLYYLCGNNTGSILTGSIVRVDPNDIEGGQYNLIQGLAGTTTLSALAGQGNYLYTIQSNVTYKWDATTGALIGQSASAAMGGSHGGGVFSPDGQYVYFAGGARIVKVHTTTLSQSFTSLFYFNGYGSFSANLTDDIAYLNGYIYAEQDDNSDFGLWKVNADDLSWSWYGTTQAYPTYYGGFGCFTDGRHLYVCQRQEMWVYLNGDVDSGPIRFFPLPGRPNEVWITDDGRLTYTDWDGGGMVYQYNLPITELGINKIPSETLDIAGIINADIRVQSPTISASTLIETNALNIHGNVTLYDPARISSNLAGGKLLLSASIVRAPTISSSAALLGRADIRRISASYGLGSPISITRSIWTLADEGMYRLTVAGTIAFYSGSTVQQPPSWSFVHTDRLGTYSLPPTPPTLVEVTNPTYDKAYSFCGDYIFQALGGSTVAYYYDSYGVDPSSTTCTASFITSVTLTQIASGSVITSSL